MIQDESTAGVTKPRIRAKDILRDMRAGLDDAGLMKKHNLSARGLHSVFKKLVRADVITEEEIRRRSDLGEDTVIVEGLRKSTRVYPALAVAVHDAENPSDRGILRDVSERGIGTRGLTARVGERRTLVVRSEDFDEFDELVLDAVCRWARLEEPGARPVASFEVTNISDKALAQLRKLIHLVSLSFDE